MKKISYKKSGVDISKSDLFIKHIASSLKDNNKNRGDFGAISKIPSNLKTPHIITSADGVGTKILLAEELKKFDTIGIDLVAMCVNDLLVQGGKPFVFLDYIAMGKFNMSKLKDIFKGIKKGCALADCKLVGGETAEMPDVYTNSNFDLAGFSVGIVEEEKILSKDKIKEGDIVMAVPSSGLHSNGFSLVRKVIKENKINFKKDKFLSKEIIKPTKIYTKEIIPLIENDLLNSCANITGGGLKDNLKRVIPNGFNAEIELEKIKVLKIFKYLNKYVEEKEMLRVLNCGVGFCLVVDKKNVNKIKKYFSKKYQPYQIGVINKNTTKNPLVKLNGKISF